MTTRYSEKLNQQITINPDNSVICQDGTNYSKSELSLLNNCTDKGIMAVHKLKNAFNGVLNSDVI